MKLLLLGTGGYHPSEQRHTLCLMLPELGIVLDAGTAMFRVRDHLTTRTMDIFLTHAHLDHVVGLTFLFDILRDQDMQTREMDHIRVFGQPEKLDALQQHLFSKHLFPILPPIEWMPLSGLVKLPHETTVRYFPLDHPGGSVGYRLDWPDRSMAYVTDTTADENADYVRRIRGVDVLVHECYFPDQWQERAVMTGHSCTTAVANVARAAEVGRLILVHINPLATEDDSIDLPRARAIFPDTDIGTDQLEMTF